MRGAEAILRAVVPDLEQRVGAFTVLSEPAPADLQQCFHEYLDGALPELQAAVQRGDWAAVMRQAHSLKGAGGGVGYPEISVLSESMERAARESRGADVRLMLDALAAWQAAERERPA